MKLSVLVLVGVLMELAYISFYFFAGSAGEVLLFMVVNAFAFLLLTYVLVKGGNPTSNIFLVVGFGVLFRFTLLFHAPVGSDDVYRYVWDGKVSSHGINPFAFAPNDPVLSALHTDVLPSRVNHPAMRTIYPPLAQFFFLISYRLFGDSVTGLKLLLVIADILTMLVLIKLQRRFPHNGGSALLLYAWSPLPIMYFALDGHIDALGILFLILCLYLISRKRNVAGAVSLGLAVLAKLYPLFVAPFLFTIEKGWKKLLLPLIPVSMLVIGYLLYWEPTGGLVESFKVFNSVFEFNGSVFAIIQKILESNEQAHAVCTVCFLAWLSMVFFLQRSLPEKVFLSFLGFIIFAPVVQPWYLTWLAALLVLRWSTAVFVLLGLSNLSNIIVYQYRLTGVWVDSSWLLIAEYFPFYLLLGWELSRRKFHASGGKSEIPQ